MRIKTLVLGCALVAGCAVAGRAPGAAETPPRQDTRVNVTPLTRSGGDAAAACAELGAETRADASLPEGRWTLDGDCGSGAIDFQSMRFADGAGGTCRVTGSERRQCAAIVHAECGSGAARHIVQWQILRPGAEMSELLVFHTDDGRRGAMEIRTIARCPVAGRR